MIPAPPMFGNRIYARHVTWYRRRHEGIHSPRDCHRLRGRDDDDALWQCCPFWQRKLNNKWNAREFAVRHGASPPELYWCGRDPDQISLEKLPRRFVVRATSGTACARVLTLADGVDLLTGRPCSRTELLATLRRWIDTGFSRTLLLVEEFIESGSERPALPPDYKVHVFGDHVAAVQVVRRLGAGRSTWRQRFYTEKWEPFGDPLNTFNPQDSTTPPPECLDDILGCARRLGRAFGAYVRVDFYASPRGAVFGEFAPTPYQGAHFTPYADAHFEELWRTHTPGSI
jgi:hypothetical protein